MKDSSRKRSDTKLQQMHRSFKTFKENFTSNRRSPPRARAGSMVNTPSPPVSQPLKSEGRGRSSTIGAIDSTTKIKKIRPPKKIISANDNAAQQKPSIFQFVLGR